MRLGETLGPYEVLEKLGEGGMGEVFKARDTRLGREVALKILPADVARDAERRARFEREARAVAALTHPHIVTLYSLEEAGGMLFITLELVEGETVAALIAQGRMPLRDVLRVASAVADAVGYAHGRGILHRDLKPANLMLTRDGRVKVLDFGLAKLKEPPGGADRSASAVTRLEPLTDRQVVLGTPEYMSPEQAESGTLDHRSDIFSLGVVLYELTTGERPFKGSSAMSVITAVLRDTPRPVTDLDPLAPPALAEIVRRCLAKDPALRYQTAHDLRDDLDALRQQVDTRATPVGSAVATPATPARRSVAVLPFLNLSADPENEFFADGITEDVIAQLSKVRALKVISRTSAMQFKKRGQSLGEIAAKLGVATLVEGSVRKSGTRVRIVADLVDAATDEHLWAETYDRQLTDVFEIQSDVALRIADALRAELTPAERARIEGPAPVNPEAYQLFLKGRQCLNRYTEVELRRAIEYFERAIALEERYAPAYDQMGLAYVILALGHGAGAVRPREAHSRARQAVARALEIDPHCGDAYGTRGALAFMADYDWSGAEQSLRHGLELNPGNALMLDLYGLLLGAQERYDEAIAAQRRARELDPLAPVHTSDLTTALLRAGRYDEALREARRLVEMEPAFPLAHSTLGWTYLLRGQPAEGLAELQAAVSLSPANTVFLAQLGEAYGLQGDRARALDVLAQLQQMAGERYVMPYHFAYVYTGLGEHDKAIDLLEEAVDERAGGAYGIKGSFLFTALRAHPRFKALLRKINLDDRYRTGSAGG
jgi:serine/threonine protein kinase/tetratricopeptide (TPR) repeat protein